MASSESSISLFHGNVDSTSQFRRLVSNDGYAIEVGILLVVHQHESQTYPTSLSMCALE